MLRSLLFLMPLLVLCSSAYAKEGDLKPLLQYKMNEPKYILQFEQYLTKKGGAQRSIASEGLVRVTSEDEIAPMRNCTATVPTGKYGTLWFKASFNSPAVSLGGIESFRVSSRGNDALQNLIVRGECGSCTFYLGGPQVIMSSSHTEMSRFDSLFSSLSSAGDKTEIYCVRSTSSNANDSMWIDPNSGYFSFVTVWNAKGALSYLNLESK